MPLLHATQISKAFHSDTQPIWALHEVDIAIDAGEVVVLAGPSGSGKSTLLSLLGGLSRPTQGRVYWQGQVMSNLPDPFLTALRRKHFGFMFQHFNLIRGLTALDNVLLPAYPLGIAYPILLERAEQLLTRLQLAQRLQARVETLSGGEAQRVALARALMNQPEVLIADEPTAHLDSRLGQTFMDLMTELQEQGLTILISSHDPVVLNSPMITRCVALRDGRVGRTQDSV